MVGRVNIVHPYSDLFATPLYTGHTTVLITIQEISQWSWWLDSTACWVGFLITTVNSLTRPALSQPQDQPHQSGTLASSLAAWYESSKDDISHNLIHNLAGSPGSWNILPRAWKIWWKCSPVYNLTYNRKTIKIWLNPSTA